MDRPHCVYRFFNEAGELLYVGLSANPLSRLTDHQSNPRASRWAPSVRRVDILPYATRDEAKVAEAKAIREEKPLHNIAHNGAALDARFHASPPPTQRTSRAARRKAEKPPLGPKQIKWWVDKAKRDAKDV